MSRNYEYFLSVTATKLKKPATEAASYCLSQSSLNLFGSDSLEAKSLQERISREVANSTKAKRSPLL
jgi:hypothetical protein